MKNKTLASNDGITDRRYQRKVGIIGGMGPLASSWLLHRVLELSGATDDQEYPEIVLHSNSAVPDRTRALVYGGQTCVPELLRSLSVLQAADVQVASICCMTAHAFYRDIVGAFPGYLIHLPTLVAKALRADQGRPQKIGIIGSTGMLKAAVLQHTLEQSGFEVLHLEPQEQEELFMNYMYGRPGIKTGVINDDTRAAFRKQVQILKARGADVVVGATSEIPLVLGREDPYFNAFEIQAQELLRLAKLSERDFESYLSAEANR